MSIQTRRATPTSWLCRFALLNLLTYISQHSWQTEMLRTHCSVSCYTNHCLTASPAYYIITVLHAAGNVRSPTPACLTSGRCRKPASKIQFLELRDPIIHNQSFRHSQSCCILGKARARKNARGTCHLCCSKVKEGFMHSCNPEKVSFCIKNPVKPDLQHSTKIHDCYPAEDSLLILGGVPFQHFCALD